MRRPSRLIWVFLCGALALPVDIPQGQASEMVVTPVAAQARSSAWDLFAEAQRYETGKGVARSWPRALELYERVMRTGDRKAAGLAALAIGNHYYGIRARSKAAPFYTKGASFGEPWSMLRLGELSEKGLGVPRSAKRAREFYERVAQQGAEPKARMYAYSALGRLHLRRPLQDNAKAISYYQRAVGLGEYWSAYSLAEIYGKQKRTAKNKARVRQMLLIAVNSGDPKARRAAMALSRKLGVSLRSSAADYQCRARLLLPAWPDGVCRTAQGPDSSFATAGQTVLQ